MSRDGTMILNLEEIVVPSLRRAPNADTIKRLAESIKQIGLQHPITVRPGPGKQFTLVAGLHRFEAVRSLREEAIRASIMKADDVDARLWEISENLHRAELTALERAEQIDEWRSLTAEKVRRDYAPSGGSQPAESGNRKVAKELGISEGAVRLSSKIAGILPEAKEAAREAGIDSNQSALLRVASASPEQQRSVVVAIAEAKARKPISPSDAPRNDFEMINLEHRALVGAWEKARAEARERFLIDIGAVVDRPIMDGRFA